MWVACGSHVGAYRLASRWLEGGSKVAWGWLEMASLKNQADPAPESFAVTLLPSPHAEKKRPG